MNRKYLNKKGAVGLTLTWFVAFMIIVFIMLVYVVLAGFLAAKKSIPIVGGGKNAISISTTSGNLETQRKLFEILNSPLGNGATLKQLVINFGISKDETIKEKIKEALKKSLEKETSDKENCYIFAIDDDFIYNKGVTEYLSKAGVENLYNLKENSAETGIFFNHQKVNLKLYSKKC